MTTLDRFDHGALAIEGVTRPARYTMTYETAMEIVAAMKSGFGSLFGLEKDQGFKSALGATYQTFGGDGLYPSIEEKAANLLYLVVKNHAFSDGNKRIGAALFITSLAGKTPFTAATARNVLPITPSGSPNVADCREPAPG